MSYVDATPVLTADQYDGGTGPLHVIAAQLQRQNATTHVWQETTFHKKSKIDSLELAVGQPAVPLPPRATVVLRYRMTADRNLGAGRTNLHLYIYRPSAGTKLAELTQSVCLEA